MKTFFDTIYQRSVAMGAVVPAAERWRVYLIALSVPAFIAMVIVIMVMEPDPWSWRVFLGWALLGAGAFSVPIVALMLYGHHRPEKVNQSWIDPGYQQTYNFRRNLQIGLGAAAAIPALIRLASYYLFGFDVYD